MPGEEEAVFGELAETVRRGGSAALAVLVSNARFSPRKAGARMLVRPDGTAVGTIGGGALESLVTAEARKALAAGTPVKVSYRLDPKNPDTPRVCSGGEVEVFIDVIRGRPPLIVIGGGHVGEAIGRVAEAAGLPYLVADDREGFVSRERFPGAAGLHCGPYRGAVAGLSAGPGAYLVICTRSHAHDLLVLREALATEAAYIGLVASARKTASFRLQIEKEGAVHWGDRVFSPVGLDLGDSSPGQIAVSVVAEVLKLQSGGTGRHKRLPAARAVPGPQNSC
jgi:xanthine dehydrogenase accessory factor